MKNNIKCIILIIKYGQGTDTIISLIKDTSMIYTTVEKKQIYNDIQPQLSNIRLACLENYELKFEMGNKL
jgi:hypothetical protein